MKKTNNKGFSLVELIIVIAIMAVLVAVMAPSFIKYVEQSRASTDMQNVAAITSAIQVWAVDPDAGNTTTLPTVGANGEANVALSGTGTITITQNGAATATGTGVAAALANAGLDLSAIQTQARTTWQSGGAATTTLTIAYTVQTDGSVTFTYTPPEISGNSSAANNGN